MDIGFKEDKNGKITDSDELFDTIDEQLDNEKYDAVVEEILSIPREKWSNKLRFKLINAYSNQKEFDKAQKELAEAGELCITPNDAARCHYSRGYLYEMSENGLMARVHYTNAAKVDPEYAKEIGIEEDINDCEKLISEDLAGFRLVCETVCADIKKRCAENSAKKNISIEGFQMRLGFFPGIRKLPGFERPMGFEDYYAEYKGEDKAKCLKWFENFYGITDEESFFRHIRTDRDCNLSRMIYDVAAFLAGKPYFDINELDEDGRFAFESTMLFSRTFMEFLPKAGISAWDISEKIGFARHAQRCGIISDAEYNMGMQALSDEARMSFSSWEEYMTSLIMGAAMYIFSTEECSISSAAQFVLQMTPLLLKSDLGDAIWYDLEK